MLTKTGTARDKQKEVEKPTKPENLVEGVMLAFVALGLFLQKLSGEVAK